jgi:ABC-type nitrate/sulfonate/bicarbonate transport system permease component
MQTTAPSANATKPEIPLGPRLLRAARSPRAARVTFPIVVLLAWQVIAPLIPSRILPMPSEVAEEMWTLLRDGVIVEGFSVSLIRLGLGFTFALVVGTALGIAMGVFARVEAMLHDFVVVGLAFPYLIWGLLVAMWFGFDGIGPIIVVFIAALPYVMLNSAEGVRNVPKELRDMASAYGVPRGRVMRSLVLPSLSPFFFASLRYGLANGWKGLVLAEVFSATTGAGYTIESLADYGNFAGVIAVSFYFAIFSIIVERLVFGRLSTRVFRWRPSIAAEVTEMPETAQQ